MATKTLTTRIIIRNDTSTNWTTANPVLMKGEIGLELDTNRYKRGDGTTTWDLLPYFSNITLSEKTSLDELIEMLNNEDFGKVDDVQVNGTTVVNDKIANISIGVLTTTTTTQAEVTNGESFTNNIVLHKIAKTGDYNDLLNKLNVVDNLDSVSTTDALSANQGNVLKSMVQALPSAKSFADIEAMITTINSYSSSEMNVGTSLYLQELNVPDFWVYSKETTSVPYTYTDDSAFISAVETAGSVQVGYYKLSLLETAKVDLTDYYTKTEVDNLLTTINNSITTVSDDVEAIINNTIYINSSTNSFIAGNPQGNTPTSTATNRVSIGSCFCTDNYAITIGTSTQGTGTNAIGIGYYAAANNNNTIAIGTNSWAGNFYGIGIGYNAESGALGAIQLGAGENSNENTFQVYNYQVLNADGKIPDARLNDTVLISTDTLILDGGSSDVSTN